MADTASAPPPDPGSRDTAYRDRASAPRKKAPPTIWQRAVYRWTAITAVLAVFLVIYTQHPYYARGAQFAPWRPVFTGAFVAWLALGVFYVKATIEKFHERRYVMRDSGLHLVLLARAFTERRFWRMAKKPRLRTSILAIFVKAFFTPLMTGFFAGHLNSIQRAWMQRKHLAPIEVKVPHGANALAAVSAWAKQIGMRLPDLLPNGRDVASLVQPWTWSRAELSWGLGFAYDLIFAVDCGFALVGYATESRWLGNKTRSVESTTLGWAACIFCYPPFNNVLGTYLPLDSGPPTTKSESILLALRAGTVLLFAIYAAATVSFGVRFSNLTNRGIVQRGPYRFVRHPAYLCKCTAWWLEHVPTMTLAKAFFLTLLCGVYALRAWTEERHLGQDPDYRAYKKKVRWVLFPGLY